MLLYINVYKYVLVYNESINKKQEREVREMRLDGIRNITEIKKSITIEVIEKAKLNISSGGIIVSSKKNIERLNEMLKELKLPGSFHTFVGSFINVRGIEYRKGEE